MPRLTYYDTSRFVREHVHGHAHKDMVVLHETVSPDAPGLKDIIAIEAYLASKDFGIHGMTDAEGNIAWAGGYGNAILWQAGGVNSRSVGIEQVSRAPYPPNALSYWINRPKQLRATAHLLAAIHNTWDIPLVYSDGLTPGVCGHWNVSQHFPQSEGHIDVWPRHKGGNYPLLSVIKLAKTYALTGVRL